MTLAQARAFIAVDEWVGWAVCLYLHRVADPLFAYVLAAHLVATYLIAYPLYWYACVKVARAIREAAREAAFSAPETWHSRYARAARAVTVAGPAPSVPRLTTGARVVTTR